MIYNNYLLIQTINIAMMESIFGQAITNIRRLK